MTKDETNDQPKRRPPSGKRQFLSDPEFSAERAAVALATQRRLKEDHYKRQGKSFDARQTI